MDGAGGGVLNHPSVTVDTTEGKVGREAGVIPETQPSPEDLSEVLSRPHSGDTITPPDTPPFSPFLPPSFYEPVTDVITTPRVET